MGNFRVSGDVCTGWDEDVGIISIFTDGLESCLGLRLDEEIINTTGPLTDPWKTLQLHLTNVSISHPKIYYASGVVLFIK